MRWDVLPTPEFRVGDKVRVVLSEQHQTPHTGRICRVVWHFGEERYNYYIEEDGKKVSTRYFATDLEHLPTTEAGS